MTLHDAIQAVLKHADRPRSTREIADAVNARGLYVRNDGRPVAKQKSIAGTTAEELGEALLHEDRFQIAADIDSLVPNAPGLYAIRVVDIQVLPELFGEEARRRDDQLIYIGEAKTSLRTRFLNQELRARGNGTFFRSLGAVLGYRPAPGTLADNTRKQNYTFAPVDERAIVEWINANLEVSWIPLGELIHETEVDLIRTHGPLLNLDGNPRALGELRDLRRLCREIAGQHPASGD